MRIDKVLIIMMIKITEQKQQQKKRKPQNTTIMKGEKLKGFFSTSSKEKGCETKFSPVSPVL